MKDIIFIDPLSPIGHIDINQVMVDIIRADCNLTVISSDKYFIKKFNDVNYISIDSKLFEIKSNSIDNRIRLLKALKIIGRHIRKMKNIDAIFISSYEPITFALGLSILKVIPQNLLSKTYMLNHSNVDDINSNKIKKIAFNSFCKKINQIYYENYIGKFINAEFGINVNIIRHNLSNYKKLYAIKNVDGEILDFFSDNSIIISLPSTLAYKDKIISQIIETDYTGFLTRNHIKFFIKDKEIQYSSKNVLIYNHYLSQDSYDFVFDKSSFVMIVYDKNTYKYRVSGVYFDALTFEKPIIYIDNAFFMDQVKRFGNMGVKYNFNVYDLIEEIKDLDNDSIKKNIKSANNYYCDSNVKADFRKVLSL